MESQIAKEQHRMDKGIATMVVMAALVVAADQLTKLWVSRALDPGQSVQVAGIFHISYVTNTGAAFGILRGQSMLLTVAALVVVAALLIFYRQFASISPVTRISLGLVLGGSLGNLVDRLRLGHVVDFLDFTYWPSFNVADSSIVVGEILLVYSVLFLMSRKKDSA